MQIKCSGPQAVMIDPLQRQGRHGHHYAVQIKVSVAVTPSECLHVDTLFDGDLNLLYR